MSSSDETAILRRTKGRVCVFKEKTFMRLVRVAHIDIDQQGATFELETIPSPGFDHDDRDTFTVSGSWDALGVSERSISATWVSWILVIRPDLVDRIKLSAAQGTTGSANA